MRKGVFQELVSFHGQLLVAVDNERRGFGLWKLVNGIQNSAEPVWEPVLLAGAGRYLLNANVQTLAVWGDSLYIVAGVSSEEIAGKYKEKYHASGFELLRLVRGWGLGPNYWNAALFFPGNQGTSGRLRF